MLCHRCLGFNFDLFSRLFQRNTRSYPDLNFELACAHSSTCGKPLIGMTWTARVKSDQPLGVTAISATSDTAAFYLPPSLIIMMMMFWWCSDNSAGNPHPVHCDDFALHRVRIEWTRVVWAGPRSNGEILSSPCSRWCDMTCTPHVQGNAWWLGKKKKKINLSVPVWLSSITLAVGSIITK